MDNFPTPYILNRAPLQSTISLFYGGIHKFYGQIVTFMPGKTAFLQCIFPHPLPPAIVPVTSVIPGIIGLIQANEAIEYNVGTGTLLTDTLPLWDGLFNRIEKITVNRDPHCVDCENGIIRDDA
ncbi:MAG: hypothetical protein NT074_03225 [Methanomicrobiales archaeon]|nr:hypothetical protein [Methanomicrobiales archaeon]